MLYGLESFKWNENYLADSEGKDPEDPWCSVKTKLLELKNEVVPIRTIETSNKHSVISFCLILVHLKHRKRRVNEGSY